MSRAITSREPDRFFMTPPTDEQWRYVHGMRRKLHLSETLLNNHCIATFKCPMARLDRRQVSSLIDELKEWVAIPAELQKSAGQTELPGL